MKSQNSAVFFCFLTFKNTPCKKKHCHRLTVAGCDGYECEPALQVLLATISSASSFTNAKTGFDSLNTWLTTELAKWAAGTAGGTPTITKTFANAVYGMVLWLACFSFFYFFFL